MTNQDINNKKMRKSSWRQYHVLLLALLAAFILSLTAYATRVHSSAQALINSASAIGSAADAEREIGVWQSRSHESSWEHASPQTGDRIFDTRVENGLLHSLHICPPTVVSLSITMRGDQLRGIILVMFTGSEEEATAGVWVQEWFDSGTAKDFYVNKKDKPLKATVEFSSAAPKAERQRALALNASCMVKLGGCRSAEEILPALNEWVSSDARK